MQPSHNENFALPGWLLITKEMGPGNRGCHTPEAAAGLAVARLAMACMFARINSFSPAVAKFRNLCKKGIHWKVHKQLSTAKSCRHTSLQLQEGAC